MQSSLTAFLLFSRAPVAGDSTRMLAYNARMRVRACVRAHARTPTHTYRSVEGKDKVFRLFFFGFKLLRAATQRKMLPLQLLETNLLDARRVFRLFREIETFQALMRQVNLSAADWCIKTCSVAQMIALCGVFVSSHLTLLSKVKLVKLDIGRARLLFGLFFLIVVSSGLLQDLRRMLLVQRRLSELAAVSHAGDSSSSGSKQQAERDAKRSEQKETLLAFRNELLCRCICTCTCRLVSACVSMILAHH